MPPSSHRLRVVLGAQDVLERDLQPASEGPQLVESLDLKNRQVCGNCHINHPRMVLNTASRIRVPRGLRLASRGAALKIAVGRACASANRSVALCTDWRSNSEQH